MAQLYHILGAEIAHHNATFLAFFEKYLAQEKSAPTFLVVSQNKNFANPFPKLKIKTFPSKKAICLFLIQLSLKQPNAQFIFYGQFNPFVWLALFFKLIPAKQSYWHIWGADLYEVSDNWKFKLLYPLRRTVQKNIKQIWATKGDLNYVQTHLKRNNAEDKLLYFPTKMAQNIRSSDLQKKAKNAPLVVLLGNSGDRSNRHLAGLIQLHNTFGKNIRLIIPMGYPANNEAYIEQVRKAAEALFPCNQIELFAENLPFEQYQEKLKSCDLAYFIFERQQAIGTICLLTQCNIPIVLSEKNPFINDLAQQNVPFILEGDLSLKEISHTADKLAQLDKENIAFFFPNYIQFWKTCLEPFREK